MALPASSPPPTDLHFLLDGFQESIHDNLYSFWKTSQFCDLVLQMSDGVVHAHSCLLAAFSPTIAEMLTTLESYFNGKGKHSQRVVTIEIDHLTMESMKSVVASIYTGRIEASSEKINDILDTVRWLKIDQLISAVEQTCREKEEIDVDETNEMEDVDSSDMYKVVIGNENIHNTYYEEMKTKDEKTHFAPNSVALSSHTAPSLHKELDSKCENALQEGTKSSELLERSRMSLRSLKRKDNSKVCSTPSIKAEIINHSSSLALFNNVDTEEEALSEIKKNEKVFPDAVLLSESAVDSQDGNEMHIKTDTKTGMRRKGERMSLKVLVTKVSKTSEIAQLSSGSAETDNIATSDTGDQRKTPNRERKRTTENITESVNKTIKSETILDSLKCDKCKCKFESSTDYYHHIVNHPQPSFSCTECSKSFFTKVALTRHHLVEHLENKHLICDECSFQASSAKELCDHSTKQHNQSKPFRCKYPGCNFRSHSYYLVKNHMDASHVDERAVRLEDIHTDKVANLQIDKVANLPVKLSDDNLKPPYKCKKCPRKFGDIDQFKEHMSDHPVFACPECPLVFFSKQYMTTHRFTIHLQNKHLICEICSFQATTGKNLRLHSIQEHDQPKPFCCKHPGCTYRSDQYYNVENHNEAMHLKIPKHAVKKYECNYCGKKCATSWFLQDHMKVCLRLEQYLCDICGEAFNKKLYLRDHKNVVHYKFRNFKCNMCSKAFGRRSALKMHKIVHQDIYPYPCSYCSKVFRRLSGIKAHLKAMHKDIQDTTFDSNKNNNYKYKPSQKKFEPKRSSRQPKRTTIAGNVVEIFVQNFDVLPE